MTYLELINEGNKHSLNKPANTDRVYYSELQQWYTDNAFRSFSIKFVVEGTIYYRCSNHEYEVTRDHFLLASKQSGVYAYFDSCTPVRSICIDICPSSIADAYVLLRSTGVKDLDNYIAGYFDHPYFFEQVYGVRGSLFGGQLRQLADALAHRTQEDDLINEEWFLRLVEQVVMQEKDHYDSLNRILTRKYSTRKEIYRRLLQGKEYIESYYNINPSIASVARNCNLSTFHFFRSFRQAFGITPYQYMMRLRLNHALTLMKKDTDTLTDIACACGFPDVFTFSKAFKRMYGVSPVKYQIFHLNAASTDRAQYHHLKRDRGTV